MMLQIDYEACTGCKICERVCPFGAIIVEPETKKARVLDNCTLCGACVNACNFNALSIERKAVSEEELALYKDVFVWSEWEKKGDTLQIKNVALELIAKGRELADKLGETIAVILLGKNVDHLVDELFHHGADKVFLCQHDLLENYSTDGYTTVISSIIAVEKPSIVLYGATPNGRDLAPRIAARLALGLTADCTGLDINSVNQLVQTRPAFGGNIMASIISPYTRPQMSTVRPNVFAKLQPDTTRTGIVEEVEVTLKPISIRTKIVEEIVSQDESTNIEDAEILVSAGRGIGSKESLSLISDMAEELDATVSGSRALVDLGWIPHPQQVGQSGKTVAPTLYFALGISGAIQHLVGMSSSDTIVSINNDPDAPIFKVTDFGIVGDIFEIIPEFIKLLKARENK
ncbi:MAG: FAD-binding protein [Candidatus Heimdallarchaeota archaeon]|nr:4Fe-4S binding protein [Candidatus Heimdallarchaeota archaeon]MCK4954281.1 FAD-binding protein [Candidatus Heimdallarchaeota archaeon]